MPAWTASISSRVSGLLRSRPSTSAAKHGPTWRIVMDMASPPVSVRERAEELHFGGALDQAFIFAALAVGGQVRRLAVDVEGRVILVLLVEDEDVGVLRGPVGAVDQAPGLGLFHHRGLLREERRQRVALALRRPDFRHYREHVSHAWGLLWVLL